MKNTMPKSGIRPLLYGIFCYLGYVLSPIHAATLYAIDIDSSRTSGSNTSGTITTEAGFTSLNATNHSTITPANVTIAGVNFEVFSTPDNSSRIRTQSGAPNSLTRDFIFEEGAANVAVGIYFGDAGDLQAGTWKVEVWAYDYNVAVGDLEIGLRAKASKTSSPTQTTILTSNFTANENDPYTFQFESNGTDAYDVFVREANLGDRTRMNAVRLTYIPEPGVPALLLIFFGACLMKRRRIER